MKMTDLEKLKWKKENTLNTDYIPIYNKDLKVIGYKKLNDIQLGVEQDLKLSDLNDNLTKRIERLELELNALKIENKSIKGLLNKIVEGLRLR